MTSDTAMTVDVDQDFPFPLERVFADFAEDDEKLGRIIGAPVTHLVDGAGEGGRCGVGSVRRVGPPLIGLEETVLTWQRNELIEYTVSKGFLMKSHLGRLMFSATPNGSHLHYVITFETKPAFLGPFIRKALQDSLSKSLAKYAQHRDAPD